MLRDDIHNESRLASKGGKVRSPLNYFSIVRGLWKDIKSEFLDICYAGCAINPPWDLIFAEEMEVGLKNYEDPIWPDGSLCVSWHCTALWLPPPVVVRFCAHGHMGENQTQSY